MLSLIIAGRDLEKIREEVNRIFKKEGIDPVDISIIDFEKAVGIGDIRQLQKRAFTKPTKGKARGFAIIGNSGFTLDAQNALLKTLEEPPETTLIILGIARPELLLPTIVSRCKVIFTEEEKRNANDTILKVEGMKIGDKLKVAQDFAKTREEAVIFLEESLVAVREKMLEEGILGNTTAKYPTLISALQKTYQDISSTNVSPRFALENLLLNL